MLLIEENGSILVGHDLIDRDHEEFINLLNWLDTADKSDFLELFQQLFEHTVQHFDRENMLMEQLVFPAETEHNPNSNDGKIYSVSA